MSGVLRGSSFPRYTARNRRVRPQRYGRFRQCRFPFAEKLTLPTRHGNGELGRRVQLAGQCRRVARTVHVNQIRVTHGDGCRVKRERESCYTFKRSCSIERCWRESTNYTCPASQPILPGIPCCARDPASESPLCDTRHAHAPPPFAIPAHKTYP